MKDHSCSWVIWSIVVILTLAIGIYAGYKVMKAISDIRVMDLESELETANASLADLAIELEQNHVLAHAWTGIASFYADAHHGKSTASGSRFDMNAYTAAHRTLPFGSLILVLDVKRYTWTLVKINDRGPAARTGRDIDLSRAAARQLGMERDGVIPVVLMMVQGRPSKGD